MISAGRGLVAAAHQHRAVDRMAAQQFLGLHRQEIAIEHGGRLDERLGQRHRRQLDRKAAGFPDAALHIVGARAQMRVAGVEIAPGIDDADDRLAFPVGLVVAELAQPRAMTERTQIADTEPAMAAEVFRSFLAHRYKSLRSGGLLGWRAVGGFAGRLPTLVPLRQNDDGCKHGTGGVGRKSRIDQQQPTGDTAARAASDWPR